MSHRPSQGRPLATVLAELAYLKPDLVLVRGQHTFRIEHVSALARRETKSGSAKLREYLSAFDFWWEEDPDGKVVVMTQTPEGPRPLAAEYGSKWTAWTLENEGDWGTEMVLSGSLGRVDSCDGVVFERRCYAPGDTYSFSQLPSLSQKDAIRQTDDFEAHFGRNPQSMYFRFLMVPHQEVVRLLEKHYGPKLTEMMQSAAVQKIAHSIQKEGLKYPAVADEGWKRALALADLGQDLPYFEVVEPLEAPYAAIIPTLDGVRKSRDPQHQLLREGFWRAIQRIHRGIPGLIGTGHVANGQFTGGAAGIRTAWVLKPNPTTSLIDAVPIAGFYAFGRFWPEMLRMAGLPDNASALVRALEQEFGITSDESLERGTIPSPGVKI
jgi:hypothetical protein